jgi:hypothetical protein
MQKPLLENLQNDIDNLINASIPFFYSSEELQALIIDLLEETYNLINKLEEVRFKNSLLKLEHDRNNIQSYIDYYKSLHQKALENEDENLSWRYAFAYSMYEAFHQNPSRTIGMLRLNLSVQNTDKEMPEFKDKFLSFLKIHEPNDYIKKQRFLASLDLLVDIHNHLESYQISSEIIIKSTSLRLFKFFNTVTYGQKRTLAKNIEFLFASLGENVSVNPKRADKLRKIGEFQNIDLLDYQGNQKILSKGLDINEMFIDLLPKTADKLKENGFDRKGDLLLVYKEFLELQKMLSIFKP